MSQFGLLDETIGALRLLLTLHKSEHPLNTTELQNKMDELYNVKKGATGTAIKVCGSLGLIEIKHGIEKPKPATYHSLTEKGKKVAELLAHLEALLEES